MFSSESKSQAPRTVPSGNEFRQLTEREAMQTVGGCGGREFRGYSASTSATALSRPDPTVGGNNDAII